MSDRTPIASFGAILIGLGVVMFFMHYMTQSNGVVVMANITSREEIVTTDSTGKVTSWYRGTVWFVTEDGDTIHGTTRVNPAKGEDTGRQMKIVYKRDNHREFSKAMPFYLYFIYGAAVVAGIYVIYLSTRVESKKWRG